MDIQQLDKYGRDRILKQNAPTIPIQFRRDVYCIKKKASLIGFKNMDDVVLIIKMFGGVTSTSGRVITIPKFKAQGRVPIWTSTRGVDVVQLWMLLCNNGKPYDLAKLLKENQHDD